MIERGKIRRSFPSPASVGDSVKLPCSGCSGSVDPLRAARVAIFDDRFHYFCSPECRVRFVPGAPPPASRQRSTGPGPRSSRRSLVPPSSDMGPSEAVPSHRAPPSSTAPPSHRAPPSSTAAPSYRSAPSSTAAPSRRAPSSKPGAPSAPPEPPERPALDASAELDTDELDAELDADDELDADAETDYADADAIGSDAPGSQLDVPPPEPAPARSEWLVAAGALGLLGVLGSIPVAPLSTLPIATLAAVAACGALALDRLRATKPATAPLALLPPIVAAAAAVLAWLGAPTVRLESARLAGVVCAVAAGSALWITSKRRSTAAGRFRLGEALGIAATEAPEAWSRERGAPDRGDLQLGEEVVLQPGQRLTVDAVITAGQARVEPWPGSPLRVARGEGDGLLAGARVVEGALRAVVRWVGNDRAWARLSVDPVRRADRHVALARLAEQLATSWAMGLGVLAGALSLSLDVHPILAVGYAVAVAAALGNVALAELVALAVELGVSRLMARGICFRSPTALDRAGRTTSVVFCDRGTLLSGELSVASIEPSGNISESELLALLAGAHSGVASPLATALSSSLSAHKLRADATRSPNHIAGMGVTAVASNGQALVAGTRALLLERRISVASAETRIAELEAIGRTVLLVALDGRWVGLVALHEGLRAGARAATQYLLDAGVEPILLSGEARETCRALARHVGIEHVRPEVLPQDRGAEVRRLARAGGTLAVVGSSIDDAALAAAPLSINIDPRGGPLERCDIDIVSADVRDAAVAIQLSRALFAQTRAALIIASVPAAAGAVAMIVGMPAWVLPLLGFAGSVLGARRLGESGFAEPARAASAQDASAASRAS